MRDNLIRMNFMIDKQVKNNLRKEADRLGVTMSGLINFMINDYMKQQAVVNMAQINDFIMRAAAQPVKPDPDKKDN